MDPIGTVRREDFGVHQYAIWVRQDPGYPDSEMTDTEWTCIWSTDPGREGTRIGCGAIEQTDHPIIGVVPGTPAETGSDVEPGDNVRVYPDIAVWSDDPLEGEVIRVVPPGKLIPYPTFEISGVSGRDFPDRNIYLSRRDFELLGDED